MLQFRDLGQPASPSPLDAAQLAAEFRARISEVLLDDQVPSSLLREDSELPKGALPGSAQLLLLRFRREAGRGVLGLLHDGEHPNPPAVADIPQGLELLRQLMQR